MIRPTSPTYKTRNWPAMRSAASRQTVPTTPANATTRSRTAARMPSSRPQEREALEDDHCRSRGAQRGPAGIDVSGPRIVATMERIPPPEPRRDMSRARERSGGSFSRRLDALCETAGPAADGAGLRPPGRRAPGPHRRPEWLHRPRHTRHRDRRISLSGERGGSAVSRCANRSPDTTPGRLRPPRVPIRLPRVPSAAESSASQRHTVEFFAEPSAY